MAVKTKKILAAAAVAALLVLAFFWSGNGPPAAVTSAVVPVPTATLPPVAAVTPIPTAAPLPSLTAGVPPIPPSPTASPIPPTTELTPPTPSSPAAPTPIATDTVTATDTAYTCTLSVRCGTLLDHLDVLTPEKAELVPSDGVLFPTTTVTFYEGESAFNLLQREMKGAAIHMESNTTPLYLSAYIEGIGNLYEFDCGDLSGWMYRVNDLFPNYGCGRYLLQPDDKVEFVYTCDQGADVGGSNGGTVAE